MTTNDNIWLESMPEVCQNFTQYVSGVRTKRLKFLRNPEVGENDLWMRDYRLWNQEDLIERIMELEAKTAAQEDALRASLREKTTRRRSARGITTRR